MIRLNYDERTAGTKVAFIMKDEEQSLEVGAERLHDGERPTCPDAPEFCMDYPCDVHNMIVIKDILLAMIRRELAKGDR